MIRKIIRIDEQKCNGCGDCTKACAEGALEIINGKAKLISDIYCDGLGACLGECPAGALEIVEEECNAFDEEKVKKHLKVSIKEIEKKKIPCGCPSAQSIEIEKKHRNDQNNGRIYSELTQWPLKLQLLNPNTPFLKNQDLLLLADCSAVAYPELHRDFLKEKKIATACPKFDDINAHIERIVDIINIAEPKSISVLHMEVPCCFGLYYAALEALEKCGNKIPFKRLKINRSGEILE